MRSIRNTRGLTAWLCSRIPLVALAICWTTAHAVVIAPVLVEISPTVRVASITVSNPDNKPISFQSQVLSWQQIAGIDRYEETSQLIVVPPIAEIPAGGSQIFRVTTHLPPGPQESAFRLILEDVSQVAAPEGEEVSMQVVLRVNHNLPVFFATASATTAEPRVSACGTQPSAGRGCVRIENPGNGHVVVKSIALANGEWQQDLPVSGRVLAGSWKQWDFDVPGNLPGKLKVSAETSAGAIAGELPID